MNGILNPLNSGGTSFYPLNIAYSAKFDSARSCKLTKTFVTPTANTTWTLSTWIKLCDIITQSSTNQVIFQVLSGGSTAHSIDINNNAIAFYTGTGYSATSTALLRDPGAWGHLVITSNGSSTVAYYNNVQILSYAGVMNLINSAQPHAFGVNIYNNTKYLGAYLADVYFIDGQALSPSTFGQYSPQNTNVWTPKNPGTLTYGNNGFHLNFSNASALGTDVSGRSNTFTSSGLVSTDQMLDTPTNNFCTMNPIGGSTSNNYPLSAYGYSTFANGNLKVGQTQGSAPWIYLEASMGITSKTYFEVTFNTLGAVNAIGPKLGVVYDETCIQTQLNYLTSKFWGLHPASGNKYTDATSTAYGSAFSNGQTVGVAVDPIAGKIWFRDSSGWFSSGDPSTGANPAFSGMDFGKCIPVVEFGATTSWNFNFGANAFTFAQPTGFKTLSSNDMSDPAIIDSSIAFNAKTYIGSPLMGAFFTGGTATASDYNSAWDLNASKAFDSGLYIAAGTSSAQCWQSNGSTGNHWLQYQLPTAKVLTSYTMLCYASGYPYINNAPTAWTLYGSNTGAFSGEQVTLDSRSGVSWTIDKWNDYTFSNNTAYLYYRWLFTASPANGVNITVIEIAGNTASTQNITSFNFQPDLVWLKDRTTALDHWLFDSVRGAQKILRSNSNIAEDTSPSSLTSFLSNGFAVGSDNNVNKFPDNFVSWCWKKSADFGFDIVSYTGTGTNRTVAHNLGAVPEMMIFKNRDTASLNWPVYHHKANATPQSGHLYLSTADAFAASTNEWNSTAPTSSVFSVGTASNINENTKNIIAYLFRSVPGFSMFGSYVGNGNADGPFVYCGFRPRFIMVKRIDSTDFWRIIDAARKVGNVAAQPLFANSNSQEGSGFSFDILSNGFKERMVDASYANVNGATYIFAAFAEAPFKYSNAR